MKPNTQKLYELTINANDIFVQKYSDINTSVGLMDQALRKKGIPADAVTVDAIRSKNRIVFILLDADITTVGVGIGNTDNDSIEFIDKHKLATLSAQSISNLLINHLI